MTLSGISKALPRTAIAISSKESRFTLNGFLLEGQKDGKALMISTDGHRLSKCEIASDSKPFRVLLPKRILAELGALKLDAVCFGASGDHSCFQNGRRWIACRNLTGSFPDYESVIPKSHAHGICLGTEPFATVVQRANVFADNRSHCVRIGVHQEQLTVTGSCERGSAVGKLAVPGSNGINYVCGFNAQYLMEFLNLAPEAIQFGFIDDQSAATLSTDDGWVYFVMPMRI